MRPLIAILILLAASVADAQKAVVTVNQPGTYLVTVANGQIVMEPVTVITVGTPPITPPTDPPEDPPTDPINLASLTTVSAAEFAKIPNGTMKQVMGLTVSTVYRKIAADLRSGGINVAAAAEHLASIRNALPVDWNLWKNETSKAWNALQDKGAITSAETWAAASEAVADGIAPQGALEAFEYDPDEFLDNPFVTVLIDMLMDLLGKSDSPIAKWLPMILKIVTLFF